MEQNSCKFINLSTETVNAGGTSDERATAKMYALELKCLFYLMLRM